LVIDAGDTPATAAFPGRRSRDPSMTTYFASSSRTMVAAGELNFAKFICQRYDAGDFIIAQRDSIERKR
jgi:hypothetical protein